MKNLIVISILCLWSINAVTAQNTLKIERQDSQPFSIGEIVTMQSAILSESRTLNIYLPEGYDPDSLTTYPVIYLLDGSADEDFIHIAGLVQFATFPWIEMLPKSILVGIANTDRKRDFTYPTNHVEDKKNNPTSGHSAQFIDFIEKELQPFIANRYRVNNQKTIIGQSLGGLLATEILLKKPSLFTHYIIVSPSLWWDDESLLKLTPKVQDSTAVFVSVGKEGEIMENDAKALFSLLNQAEYENLDVDFHFFENQNHGNILHLAVYKAFETLFKK